MTIITQKQFFSIFGHRVDVPPGTFMPEMELAVLVALCRRSGAGKVVEFGCQDGGTAKVLLDACGGIDKYIGIDLPAGERPVLELQHTEVPQVPGLKASVDKRFRLILKDSNTLSLYDVDDADFVFIDGGHDYLTVLSDTQLAMEMVGLRGGGVIVWHDYNHHPEICVKRVVDELNEKNGGRIVLVDGTWLCFYLA